MALVVKEPLRVEDDSSLATYNQEKASADRITATNIGGRPAVKFYRHYTDAVVNSGKRCELKRDVWSHERAMSGMYTQWTSLYLPREWEAKLPFLNGDFSNGQSLYYCHLQQWAAATGVTGSGVPPFTLTLWHEGIGVWDWVTNDDPYGPIVLAKWAPVYDRWIDIVVEAKWRAHGGGLFRMCFDGKWVVYRNTKTVPEGSTQGPKWGEGMYWGAGEYPFEDGCTVYKAGYKLMHGYGNGFPQTGVAARPSPLADRVL